MQPITKDSCILITSSSHKDAKEYAINAFQTLKSRGYLVYLDSFLSKEVDDDSKVCLDEKLHLIFVFGGDGTILKTYAKWKNAPILGFNCGKVGFLTETCPEDFDTAIRQLESGDYIIENFNTLVISTPAFPSLSAANDLVVTSDKIGQIVTLKVELDGQYLYTVGGDGLIVSTSVGSSAYSLSAGGSLLMPNVNAFTLVPICPFSRRIFPMVVSQNTTIRITNVSEYRAGNVIIDGNMYYSLGNNESIEITKSNDTIKFVRFSKSYVPRVRKKLLRYDPEDFLEKD